MSAAPTAEARCLTRVSFAIRKLASGSSVPALTPSQYCRVPRVLRCDVISTAPSNVYLG